MEKTNFEILSTNSRYMSNFNLFWPTLPSWLEWQKIKIFQKNFKFDIVSMKKDNFEILNPNNWDMGRLRLFQASQGKGLAGEKKILPKVAYTHNKSS